MVSNEKFWLFQLFPPIYFEKKLRINTWENIFFLQESPRSSEKYVSSYNTEFNESPFRYNSPIMNALHTMNRKNISSKYFVIHITYSLTSLTHLPTPFTHLPSLSLTYPAFHSLTQPLNHLPSLALVQPLTRLPSLSLTYPAFHLLTHSLTRLSSLSFTHLYPTFHLHAQPFTHLPSLSLSHSISRSLHLIRSKCCLYFRDVSIL